MTGWGTQRALVFDTETTDVQTTEDRIVTACASIVEVGESVFRRNWLIAVDVDIPEAASAVHGITTEHAREHGVPAATAIPGIATSIRYALHNGLVVAGHNAVFDLSILDAELRRWAGMSLEEFCEKPIGPVLDSLCIDKGIDRYRKGSRKLVDTCALFGVPLGEDAHDADADVDATGRLLYRMWLRSQLPTDELHRLYADRKYPDRIVRDWQALGRMTADELHSKQAEWYQAQSESFAQYLRQQANEQVNNARKALDQGDDETATTAQQEADELYARAEDVSTEWPIRSFTEGAAA